jgi:hypothetical protein
VRPLFLQSESMAGFRLYTNNCSYGLFLSADEPANDHHQKKETQRNIQQPTQVRVWNLFGKQLHEKHCILLMQVNYGTYMREKQNCQSMHIRPTPKEIFVIYLPI